MKSIYLFGYSGHALVVHDCLSADMKIAGYFDRIESTENPLNIPFLGNENDVDIQQLCQDGYAFCAVGDNIIREKIVTNYRSKAINEATLIHDSAVISESASIGNSVLVGPRAIVNASAKIGDGAIVNSGAIVEHECSVGQFAHIAPGSVLAGNVSVGTSTFIGANVTVKDGISIGKNVIVGAGSVVVKNIPDGETWLGVPAKKKANS